MNFSRTLCPILLVVFTFSVVTGQDTKSSSESQKDEMQVIKYEPGKQIANSISVVDGEEGERREIKFWLYTPANYEEEKSHPWMMFLHGMGERGEDLELVKQWGPPKLVADRDDFPFVLVSPQCPKDIHWETGHLIQILDAVQEQMKVDRKRLYVTGLSMGGFGTWAMMGAVPDRIAAAVPICGGGDVEKADQMTDVPVWAFHGDADRVVGLEQSQRMVDAVNEAGGSAKLKVYEGVGHNSWSATYADEDVYRWLLEHTSDR